MIKFVKNPVLIISFVSVLIMVGGVLLLSSKTASISPSPSEVLAQENMFNFGQISMKGGHVKHSFNLLVQGEKPLAISKVYTSCMCTEVMVRKKNGESFGPFGMPGHGLQQFISAEFGSGEEFELEVDFDPAAHGPEATGLVERKIILETNSEKTPKLELTISADVTS